MQSIEFFLFQLLRWLTRWLPYRTAGRIGATLGSLTFTLTSFRKNITLDNLAHAFPENTQSELLGIARGAYRNYGTVLLEMLWASSQPAEHLKQTLTIKNRDLVARAFGGNRNAILLSGHFGNWEFIVGPLRLHIDRPLSILVQPQRNARVNRVLDGIRRRFGNTTIPLGPSVREVMRVLHDGGVVAMLGDQSGPRESVFVEFFGRPAATRRGPAAFSLRTHSPMIMVFIIRQEDGRYEAVFEEVDAAGLDEYNEENVSELTRRHTVILERYVRQYPDHWLWMHKRWKHTEYHEANTLAGSEV